MTRSLYGEPDYVFGQRILTLRTSIGVTQEGLATLLSVSRKAIGRWEAGETHPKAAHLQALLVLAWQQGAFVAGQEEEEIRTFWRAAHQKVLLDERWLQQLLSQPATPQSEGTGELPLDAGLHSAPATGSGPQVDWGEALDVPGFYGRREELALLCRWIGEDRCRVVSVLGMGGIGKSALAVTVMYQVAGQFEIVIWRSLRDMPNCVTLVESCLQMLDPQARPVVSDALEDRLRLLMEQLRARRVLLVLDNWETLLEEGTGTGRLRTGSQGYGQLLRLLGETRHQSCLLLTSREKLAELVPLEGKRSPIRALRLSGLDDLAGAQLLEEKEVVGSPQDLERLVEVYQGNPLALKIVGQTITELFGGEILPFLRQGEVIFGGVRELLDEQYARLSVLEQTVFCWLAILREPVSPEELLVTLSEPRTAIHVLEAFDGLLRRSLIEQGQLPGSFTLQSVVLEYATGRLIEWASSEIEQSRLVCLIDYGLCQAQAKEYVRQIQERLLVVPLLTRVQSMYRRQADLEAHLCTLLDDLHNWDHLAQGYGPANLVALLRVLRGNLRGLDLSRLAIRGAYLQGVEMQDANLSEAMLRECVFSETFDAITSVAISRSGQYWAAVSRRGEVRVWREEGKLLHRAWQAHSDTTLALALSPDEHMLATVSEDGSLKQWDIESGALLWLGWHTQGTWCLAFSPDGRLLASGGVDPTLRLWDPKLGTLLEELPHPSSVISLAWSSDGGLLASGDFAGTIRLWAIPPGGRASCVQTLAGHSMWVHSLAFAPDGSVLVSASWDGSVKLWQVESGRYLQALSGHTDRVRWVAWSPDGGTLASGSFDHTIRLWDGKLGTLRAVLQGHSGEVYSLAFTPESRHLLSGCNDGTLRLWEVERAQCVRVVQGSVASLNDLDWSPDGRQLVSGGTDTLVTIWDVVGGRPRGVLHGHRKNVYGVAWSPDGGRLASSGWASAIRLWDPTSGSCLQIIGDSDSADTLFYGVAWSPDGKLLACGTYQRGVQVWDVAAGSLRWADRALATWLRRVAWSPDGTWVAGGGDDGFVYLWDATAGTQQRLLTGHQGAVMNVAWSPGGRRLASVGSARGGGELFVWDVDSGKQVHAFEGHSGVVAALSWVPSGEVLISGGGDGRLRWWDLQSRKCVRVREAHQGTVQSLKMSSDGSMLASCGDDGAIRLWDLESGEPLHTLRRDRLYERLTITGIQGLTDAQKASLRVLGAVDAEAASPTKL